MAYTIRTYECDGGGEGEPHRFDVLLATGEHPKFCPQCGNEVDADALPVPAKIAIGGSAIARATDQTYKLVEDSSAARAAELNAPYLKVTDMNDNLRHGDVAAKAPINKVTQFAQEAKNNLGVNYLAWGGGMGGARVGPPISTGPGQTYAGPGHVAMAAFQQDHEARVRDIVANPTHRPFRG